jgi:hypothetical protein
MIKQKTTKRKHNKKTNKTKYLNVNGGGSGKKRTISQNESQNNKEEKKRLHDLLKNFLNDIKEKRPITIEKYNADNMQKIYGSPRYSKYPITKTIVKKYIDKIHKQKSNSFFPASSIYNYRAGSKRQNSSDVAAGVKEFENAAAAASGASGASGAAAAASSAAATSNGAAAATGHSSSKKPKFDAAAAATGHSSSKTPKIRRISFGKPYEAPDGRAVPQTITDLLKFGKISNFADEINLLLIGNKTYINNYVDNVISKAPNEANFTNYVKDVYKIRLDDSITSKLSSQIEKEKAKGNVLTPAEQEDIKKYVYKSFLYALDIFKNEIKGIIDQSHQITQFYLYDNANIRMLDTHHINFLKRPISTPNTLNFIYSTNFESGKPLPKLPSERITNETYIFNLNCVMTCEADDFAILLTYMYLKQLSKNVIIFSDDQYGWFGGWEEQKRKDLQSF